MSRRPLSCDHDAILEMYKDGVTYTQIAKKMGISYGTVRNILIRYGVLSGERRVYKLREKPKTTNNHFGNIWATYESFSLIEQILKDQYLTVEQISDIIKRPESDIIAMVNDYMRNKNNVAERRCPICNREIFGKQRSAKTCGSPMCASQMRRFTRIETLKRERENLRIDKIQQAISAE